MFRSVFLSRMIFMVLIALCASAILSAALFTIAASFTVQTNRSDELINKAAALSETLSDYSTSTIPVTNDSDMQTEGDVISDETEISSIDTVLTDTVTPTPTENNPILEPLSITSYYLNYDILDAYFLLYDEEGVLLQTTQMNDAEDIDEINILDSYAKEKMLVNNTNEYLYTKIPGETRFDSSIIVQCPIYDDDVRIGYVVLGSTVDAENAMLGSFGDVLILATFVVALAMLVPVYFATLHLVRPLQKVNEVAQAMGQGDFSVRANTKSKGEIGELAVSFNELAEQLSKSITDLTVERNRLKEIFDIISEGIVSVNADLQTDYYNNAIRTLFEKAPRKNLFTEKLQLIPFEDVWTDFEECINTGETKERTIEAQDCAYQSTIVPTFNNDNVIIGATGFFRDISESERLEQTRRDYVANVSHELRTPLTAMRGLVEPLADGMVKSEADRMRYYGIILHETMRLSRLIDDMLELSRLQARTLAFKTFPFDLNKLLNELEQKFTPIMNDSELAFKVEFKTGTLPTVVGNPDRVEQIIVILIDNAKKYTPAGGSITISTEYNDETGQVFVSVIDTGQGIHEYDIDHIFDRFYKADRARGKKGTGLGLSIAKELLSYMGETITVQSEYGEGTTFTFTLKRVTGTVWY